jgi:hypothetical protein
MKARNTNSAISLGLVITFVTAVWTGGAWVSKVDFVTNANAKSIEKIFLWNETLQNVLTNIDKRLFAIEQLLLERK